MGGESFVKTWASTSTWHGVQDFVGAETKCSRAFWSTTLVLSTAMMTWQLYNVIFNYMTNPKYQTSVTTQALGMVEFPNVTICNYNRANISRKQELNMSDAALSYLYKMLPQNYKISSHQLGTTEVLRNSYEVWANTSTRNLSVNELFTYLGHDCEPTFLLCIFGGPSFPCCENVKVVLNQYGKCLSVVPGKDVANTALRASQYDPGPQGALSLVIDPNLSAYSNVVVNDLLASGIILLITNEPEAYQVDDLISLEPSTVALVSVEVVKSFVTKPDYKIWPLPCSPNAVLKYMAGNYTHNKCSTDCFIDTVVRYCNCGFWIRPELAINPCTPRDVYCLNALWFSSENWTLPASNEFRKCNADQCIRPCEDRFTFTTRVTRTTMSEVQSAKTRDSYRKILDRPDANIGEIVQLDVYYGRIEMTIQETAERLSIFDLISATGGQLGLWAGMSVISFLQLFVLVGWICKSGCGRLKTETVRKSSKGTGTTTTPVASLAGDDLLDYASRNVGDLTKRVPFPHSWT